MKTEQAITDKMAIGLSVACAIHCLFLPVVILMLPSIAAFVHIALLDHRQKTIETLDNFVASKDQIIECSSITGSNDYLLKIIETDTESLEKFIMQSLLRLGIVRSSTTNLILRQQKYTTAVPL